ncbi:MAG: transposase [Acetatifactor sp.]
MAYIVGTDRNQTRMITVSLDDLIDKDNSVRVIDVYVNSLDLMELGFVEYSGNNRGQSPYRRSDLLKLHIYGYLNKVRSSRALEVECKRNIELMWLINAITPDHGTIAGFVKKNREAFHSTLRNLSLILKGCLISNLFSKHPISLANALFMDLICCFLPSNFSQCF